ncbi:SLC13 family permease [Thiomicrospira microaerophila]|uniref:SLC13 family permease n=1 Tax=Thiomicrospira microaerophila TaxID=406020 RepID=UPI00200E5728|nr:SLC13 family permease [Thiomicrospira microaerophila]UQB43277.1 SLC13 family permease [Thiomicrospira microaerophila]
MMTFVVLGSVVVLLGLLVWGRVQAYKLFASLILIYYAFDFISLESMLGNFVNTGLITLVFLLLVSTVLEKTRIFASLANWLVTRTQRGTVLRMTGVVGIGSAFLNNTAMVATFMSMLGKTKSIAPSKLLIPLSYIAILGGTLTLIGTSTNLIINSFVVQAGLPELKLFDFLFVGFFLLLFGGLTILALGSRLLPDHPLSENQTQAYMIEAKLSDASSLLGLSIEQAGLRHLQDLYLAQVVSGDEVVAPVTPSYVLKAGDRLLFAGDINVAPKLLLFDGLSFPGGKPVKGNQFVEVVLSHQSSMIGSTIKASRFRNKFDAAVVAIRRGDERLTGRIAEVVLQPGDALVLLTGPDFSQRENLDKNFYFFSHLEDAQHPLSLKQSVWAVVGFVGVIALAAFEVLPLLKGLMLLLVVFLLMGLTRVNELRRRMPFEIVMIVGAALGIAQVMSSQGVASLLAETIMGSFGYWGVMGSFIGIYLLTVLLTEMVTNNAAAAVAFPIALVTAEALGVSPWPFIFAVAYGASASFLTPYGYQTNLMVYSPGGYKFTDYVRMGVPVSLVYGLTVILLVPVFFPF